jgi:replicative DNA helicase
MNQDTLPPHSSELEACLLGALIQEPRELTAEVMAKHPDVQGYFFDLRHQEIFRAITDLVNAGKRPDVVTVAERLKVTSAKQSPDLSAYLASLLCHVTWTPQVLAYAADLRAYWIKRMVMTACVEFERASQNGIDSEVLLADFQERAMSLGKHAADEDRDMKALVNDSMTYMEEAFTNRGTLRGISTGFERLNAITGGMKPGQLIILAARPACGKTSLAMNIAEHVAVDSGLPVGVFSLEMTKSELTFRMICSRSRVDSQAAHAGELDERGMQRITVAAAAIAKAPLVIDDHGGMSISQMRAKARRMFHRHGVRLIVVDYLQLMSGGGRRTENRNLELAEITGGLKSMAKELALPVIACSQLNRDTERDGKRKPRLSDLRDSGAIEQDADLVGFLWKDGAEETPEGVDPAIDLLIEKHRNGSLGKVRLVFQKTFTRFVPRAH